MRLSLGVASFQMLSKHLMRCQDLVLLQEKTNNRQGLWWFLCTDEHGFRTLELRTTKALLSLMSIQQGYFCSFCWSAGPLPALPLRVCLSAMHCASVWMGVWTSLGECVDLTAPGIWFAVVADFFWELHAFFPKAVQSCGGNCTLPLSRVSDPWAPHVPNPACCCLRLSWLPGTVIWSLPCSHQHLGTENIYFVLARQNPVNSNLWAQNSGQRSWGRRVRTAPAMLTRGGFLSRDAQPRGCESQVPFASEIRIDWPGLWNWIKKYDSSPFSWLNLSMEM